ncbi:MAG: DUF3187 family protein [Candidatus Brocadiia bacterium]
MKRFSIFACVLILAIISSVASAENSLKRKQLLDTELTSFFTAPIESLNNNLFHSLIMIPSLENADTIKPSYLYLKGGGEYSTANFRSSRDGWNVNYRGVYEESFIEGRYGFAERIELRARINAAAIDEKDTVTISNGTDQYLSGNGGIGLSNMILGIKIPFTNQKSKITRALGLSLKMPLSLKDNLIDSDSTDIALSYYLTRPVKPNLYLHSYLGYVITGKVDIFSKLFNPKDVFYYGAGLSWRAADTLVWINQIQGNINAFRKIDALKKNPLTIQSGIRYSEDGRFFNEFNIGTGLNKESSDFIISLSIGTMF